MNPLLKKIATAVGVIVVLFVVYKVFFASTPEAPLSATTPSGLPAEEGDLISLLLELKSIALSTEILNDVAFQSLGVDSFDLMTIRVQLEQQLGLSVPDDRWIGFTTFQDLAEFFAPTMSTHANGPVGTSGMERHIRINMPQMAVGGLSESWLFRELGGDNGA